MELDSVRPARIPPRRLLCGRQLRGDQPPPKPFPNAVGSDLPQLLWSVMTAGFGPASLGRRLACAHHPAPAWPPVVAGTQCSHGWR